MGWTISVHRRWLNIIRLWNRLVDMDDDRLTKKVFVYDFNKNTNSTWCSEVKSILEKIGLRTRCFQNMIKSDIKVCEQSLFDNYCNEWSTKSRDVSKLRTYITFKTEYKTEEYVKAFLPKQERSFLAQLRCGVLPLRIETGRFCGLKPEERICQVCDSGKIEDEKHFILECNQYTIFRQSLYRQINTQYFYALPPNDQLKYLVTQEYRKTAKFISQSFMQRKTILYN